MTTWQTVPGLRFVSTARYVRETATELRHDNGSGYYFQLADAHVNP